MLNEHTHLYMLTEHTDIDIFTEHTHIYILTEHTFIQTFTHTHPQPPTHTTGWIKSPVQWCDWC